MLLNLLENFYSLLQLGTVPPPKSPGRHELNCIPGFSIFLSELSPGVAFDTVLGPLNHRHKEELFIRLMKANFLGQGTGKGCIGLEPQEKSLTLSLCFPYEMDYKTFKETLQDFINYAEFWKGELVRLKALEQ